MAPLSVEQRTQLARHLLAIAFKGMPEDRWPGLIAGQNVVRGRLDDPIDPQDSGHLARLAEMSDLSEATSEQIRSLLRVFGLPRVRAVWEDLPADQRRPSLDRAPRRVLEAALRVALDPQDATDEDAAAITAWVGKEGATMEGYEPEARGLPPGFEIQSFIGDVRDRLGQFGGNVGDSFVAVAVGRLLLDGDTDSGRSDFRYAVKRIYDQGVSETPNTRTPNKDLYEKVVSDIRALRPGRLVRFQELASVADHVIAAAEDWDISDEASRRSQVEVGLMRYADGSADTGFSALDLPPIVSEDASAQEIEPMNVRAVGMIAAAYEIEQTGAFDVVDRMVELFMQGMLPVRDDGGGRALNRYFWQSEGRLDAGARANQYARILGAGGTSGTDVQPNAGFDAQVMRFASSLVRYDADLQVSEVIRSAGRSRPRSSELVRKAAQELAANASLYGWGFTVFAARRLSRHIEMVFDALGQETLQRAYGVTGPWQLVERVSAVEFGSTPAVVAHRTRASAIKDILDILSGYATALGRSGAGSRFLPNGDDLAGETHNSASTVSVEDYERLVTAANNLLAVTGASDEDISRYAAPTASAARGSIPTVGGDSGAGASSGGLDQIRQLVAQGQAPSLEQLQRLLPSGSVG